MKFLITVIFLLASSILSAAEPVSLVCENDAGIGKPVELTLFESDGRATVKLGDYLKTAHADFTASLVTVTLSDGNGIWMGYEVNRVDLSFRDIMKVRGEIKTDRSGECEVVRTPKRAF